MAKIEGGLFSGGERVGADFFNAGEVRGEGGLLVVEGHEVAVPAELFLFKGGPEGELVEAIASKVEEIGPLLARRVEAEEGAVLVFVGKEKVAGRVVAGGCEGGRKLVPAGIVLEGDEQGREEDQEERKGKSPLPETGVDSPPSAARRAAVG